MVLYSNPLESSLISAFNDSIRSPFSAYHTRLHAPSCKRIITVEPRFSIHSFEDRTLLEVELPGVSNDPVSLHAKDRALVVSGDRPVRGSLVIEEGSGDLIDTGTSKADGNAADDKISDSLKPVVEDEGVVNDEGLSSTAKESTMEKLKYQAHFVLPVSADPARATAEYREGLLVHRFPRKDPEMQEITIS